jgi:hypothetical protein
MFDYINGNRFLEIADFAIDSDNKNLTMQMYKKNAIIYCKTDFLSILFNYLKLSGRKYILISHMSDISITKESFESKPNCIVKWFAENAIYDHSNLISIPIGIENHKGKSKGKFTNHKWLEDNINNLKNNIKEYNLYCNWDSGTNSSRAKITSILKEKKLPIIEEYGLDYITYCTNMSKNKFVVCPPGYGIDTHRLWEALYMGCIPIVLKHRIYQYYDLPIIQVNGWEEITPELLNKPISTNTEQLYMTYWKRRIIEELNKL